MIRRTAVVLGIKEASLDRLRDKLAAEGFDVIKFIPPRKLRSTDVVIASPAYESPAMAEYVTNEIRFQVGDDVPVLLLSERSPASEVLGAKTVEKSISAITEAVASLSS